jgi:hypothetical protein
MAKFSILEHLEKLEPSGKKDGKYVCPVCGGNDLGISLKSGAYTCYSGGCERAAIRNAIAPLPQIGDQPAYPRKPKKSARERVREVQLDSARVESKVEELLLLVGSGTHTLEQAQVELGIWAKAEGLSPFDAGQLFKAEAKELGLAGGSTKTDLLTLEQTRQQLECLVAEAVTSSDIEIQIAALAKAAGLPPQTIRRIFQSIQSEADLRAATTGAADDLEQLRAIKGQHLPIESALHGDGGRLAQQLRQVAEAMPTAPEFLATTLIPTLATAMGTAQTLVIHATAGYTVRPIFRSIIVAGTGRKKTPAQGAILKAITNLEQSAALDYQHELATYEADYRMWARASKNKDDPGPEPKRPTRRRYLTQDSTLAAKVAIHAENPRGLLLYKDEASAFITERGRFTSGKGDGGEFEADLSEFNGGAIIHDRKGDGSTFLAKTAISRVGATQFSALQRLMGSHDDDCGEFARYLFCAAEAPPSKIDLSTDMGDIGLTSTIMAVFDRLAHMPEASYLLSPKAQAAFQQYQHELTDRQIAEDHPSLQSAYPKMETYFGRFILWLHLVNAALAGQSPELVVDGYTVELARQWTEYYIGQLRLVLAVNSPQQELTGDLLRAYEYLKRKAAPLDVRAIVQARLFDRDADKTKQRSPYLRELLSTLVEQGWIAQHDGLYALNDPDDPPPGAPNVEQLSETANKNGNGHHSTPQIKPLTDDELAALMGGGHCANS